MTGNEYADVLHGKLLYSALFNLNYSKAPYILNLIKTGSKIMQHKHILYINT